MTTTTQKASATLGGDYPSTWKAFIGQDQAKAQLMTAAKSARARKTSMPHTLLLSGVPGCGKTSLALLIAQEMKANVQILSGQVSVHDARMAFIDMVDGDILIIDEIHQMVQGGKFKAEWLLHYLQDGVLVTPMGVEEAPKVTIVGCTTDGGVLPRTILDRFPLQPQIVAYTEADAAKIAAGMARRILGEHQLPLPSAENCRQIARASSNSPRLMSALLQSVRDVALVHGGENITGRRYDLTKSLQWLGLSEDGLTETARRYMTALLVDFGGRPAGVSAMQDRLQEPGGLAYTELLLMEKGYLVKTTGGRNLTAQGVRRTRELAAA